MAGALIRYRIMAWIVGVLLITLVLVAMPLKYFADSPGLTSVVGTAHGFLYMVYLAAALHVAWLGRWPILPRTLLVLLAGTIPFLSFVAERYVTRTVQAESAADVESGEPAPS